MKNTAQKGQVIIILLMVMVIALTIGVAISQRATNDISISTQSEQSSQAFSAAEAGIERAIQSSAAPSPFSLGNQAQVTVTKSGKLPYLGSTLALEYPPISKEITAQFWLADPNPPNSYPYTKNSFEVYFGNPTPSVTDIRPAVEVNVITLNNSNYQSYRYYFDSDSTRIGGPTGNNFNGCISGVGFPIPTILSITPPSEFYCHATVPPTDQTNCHQPCIPFKPTSSAQPVLVRIRLLYSNSTQKIAINPTTNQPPVVGETSGYFPPQIEIYNSTGTSGQSQVTLQFFKQFDLVPPWFDFAIFSVNNIRK